MLKTSAGKPLLCHGTRSEPTAMGYHRNNGKIDFGGKIITEGDGADCSSIVHWDNSMANCSSNNTCEFAEVYKVTHPTVLRDAAGNYSLVDSQMLPVSDNEVPTSLKKRQFPVVHNKRL